MEGLHKGLFLLLNRGPKILFNLNSPTSKFSEFISPAEVALVCLKFIFCEFISPAEMALVCLKFKFHKILFSGYLAITNLWILNQGQ